MTMSGEVRSSGSEYGIRIGDNGFREEVSFFEQSGAFAVKILDRDEAGAVKTYVVPDRRKAYFIEQLLGARPIRRP